MASIRRLTITLGLLAGYMVVEVVGGLLANSLSLLADAGHMLTDAGAVGLALLAIWLAGKPPSVERTFGFHRTEVLAALANALSLWLIAGVILFEAYRRFLEPQEVTGALMLGVGAVGLLVNLAAAALLHRSARESLNVEGAFLHVLGDLLGSVAVNLCKYIGPHHRMGRCGPGLRRRHRCADFDQFGPAPVEGATRFNGRNTAQPGPPRIMPTDGATGRNHRGPWTSMPGPLQPGTTPLAHT